MALQENKITLYDKLLIIVSVIVAFLALIYINAFLYYGTPTGVEIEFDGKPYASYLFSELPYEKTLEISTNIGYNIVRIVDNTVVVSESSCKDGICQDIILSKPNQSVVCLPNKLVVKLTGKTKVDSISY